MSSIQFGMLSAVAARVSHLFVRFSRGRIDHLWPTLAHSPRTHLVCAAGSRHITDVKPAWGAERRRTAADTHTDRHCAARPFDRPLLRPSAPLQLPLPGVVLPVATGSVMIRVLVLFSLCAQLGCAQSQYPRYVKLPVGRGECTAFTCLLSVEQRGTAHLNYIHMANNDNKIHRTDRPQPILHFTSFFLPRRGFGCPLKLCPSIDKRGGNIIWAIAVLDDYHEQHWQLSLLSVRSIYIYDRSRPT